MKLNQDPEDTSGGNRLISWITQPGFLPAVARFLYQIAYRLYQLPREIKAVLAGDNLITIENELGVFFARPLTNTVMRTSPAYQPTLQRWIQDSPEGVFVDVGAGTGLFTTAALKDGSAQHVYAFEHNPSEYPLLLKHISSNNLSAECTHAALAKASGTMEMPPNTVHTKSSSVCGGSGVQVPTIAFDTFRKDADINPASIGCIKITADSHELTALEGMQETLHELKVGARVIVNIPETDTTQEKTVAFVKWCGYELKDQSGSYHLFVKQ